MAIGQQMLGDLTPADTCLSLSDIEIIAALRCGDEAAFALLLDRFQSAMLRIARMYVGSYAVAEEVVQEAWLGFFQSLDRFQGRCSLKTWIFRILTNRAKTRGEREGRSIPFSALADSVDDSYEPSVEPERFLAADHAQWPGHWALPPKSWDDLPESRLIARETREQIALAIDMLPASQRAVITLRDVEGWSADEVCQLLGVTENNQRVLLHRARSRVRHALEQYLSPV
jgi:RNA polymerase sigma-70 factor, ECF subfamily